VAIDTERVDGLMTGHRSLLTTLQI
jgi:hypothetical protein